MLSGRRKRDYEAETLAGQAAGDATTTGDATSEPSDDDPDEAPEDTSTEDERVLVLA